MFVGGSSAGLSASVLPLAPAVEQLAPISQESAFGRNSTPHAQRDEDAKSLTASNPTQVKKSLGASSPERLVIDAYFARMSVLA